MSKAREWRIYYGPGDDGAREYSIDGPEFEDCSDVHVIEHSAYAKAVAALRWYDGVHRLHWAIDLNDLDKVAHNTLRELGESSGEDEAGE